ncbi:hypothetical protein ACRE_032800 [Hapsidospora chrysogenum ATCC 11550]|uniref:Uncharacterized protein n=1 Tax=Hapsidospora chrysogenum (strain ATCC 11550 / CBS 779.69 / DSM 880 / IAM 14645 / JCM 23072 / IMI 49137) TaxID=857340 RepID=A0A086T972_HAPC1|nr:hypothetical protein ACRE_032800 [Hapsidospora chrysogenum ATCC 11550]
MDHGEAASMKSIIDLEARHVHWENFQMAEKKDKMRVSGIQVVVTDPGAHASTHQQHDFLPPLSLSKARIRSGHSITARSMRETVLPQCPFPPGEVEPDDVSRDGPEISYRSAAADRGS